MGLLRSARGRNVALGTPWEERAQVVHGMASQFQERQCAEEPVPKRKGALDR